MTKWISVKDELPYPAKNVLVTDGFTVHLSHREAHSKRFDIARRLWGWNHDSVKYWMELPQPPESES